MNSGRSKGINFTPIKMDEGGLIPKDLDQVMSTWNNAEQGPKRGYSAPCRMDGIHGSLTRSVSDSAAHLIYLVPTGQNPTGICMSSERYDQIYELAHKHDLIMSVDLAAAAFRESRR